MNKNIKLGFTKSKAYGLCGVILTAALMMVMAPRAYADEVTTATPATETVATTETPAPTAETTTETPATTEATTAETPATTTEATTAETPATTEATPTATAATADETPTISTGATEITKEGDTITVKNPDVDMHFTKGADGNGTGNT